MMKNGYTQITDAHLQRMEPQGVDISGREILLSTSNDRGGEASCGDNQFGQQSPTVVPLEGEPSIHSELGRVNPPPRLF